MTRPLFYSDIKAMTSDNETLSAVALSCINNHCAAVWKRLYGTYGSATAIIEHRHEVMSMPNGIPSSVAEGLRDVEAALDHAHKVMEFGRTHKISTLLLNDADYPLRLAACDDAPLVLFYRGTAQLNQAKVISVVGTRECTAYGKDMLRRFIRELHELCPQVLVVSGLAYGIDVNAHRYALEEGYDTVGVLAHGLDTIYPASHRQVAAQMVLHGGLLTEYVMGQKIDKYSFLRRNRIVAGISDATIIVESRIRGGGMKTVELANGYGRRVFAFPGYATQACSEGCNSLIHDGRATILLSAESFVKDMGWNVACEPVSSGKSGGEGQLFQELTDNEAKVADLLYADNDKTVDAISDACAMSVMDVSCALFTLEMKGLVRSMSGNVWHLLNS